MKAKYPTFKITSSTTKQYFDTLAFVTGERLQICQYQSLHKRNHHLQTVLLNIIQQRRQESSCNKSRYYTAFLF